MGVINNINHIITLTMQHNSGYKLMMMMREGEDTEDKRATLSGPDLPQLRCWGLAMPKTSTSGVVLDTETRVVNKLN